VFRGLQTDFVNQVMRLQRAKKIWREIHGYILGICGIALVTVALSPFDRRLSPTTTALALLLVVLLTATRWGSGPALMAALLGVACFNFFFLPPIHTFTISDPQNWVALAAFLITAVTAGELSARARRRAEEAEAGRREIERLYLEYQSVSELAKQAEILAQSEQLKSALLDAVTHDLRTPLTSIKASVTTLLAEHDLEQMVRLDPEGRHELLAVINEETDRLTRFVENMVELARLEAGALQLRRRWASIEEIVGMALERARALTADHRLELVLGRELPAACVEARLIAEVLYSLIDNATKYSPPGTEIRVLAESTAGELIQISVEDRGPGIAPELRELVFDKFYRATEGGAASLGRPKGLGMGLSIARGIVLAHGGRIWIEGVPEGGGTRVAFTIPIGDE
ncbi:MAG TPA: DUF4118 domain-containing protein, partial [Blastocatellia bacterium]|nr:DUF4118 domain-containing protein [Blastocatellia bacterium]